MAELSDFPDIEAEVDRVFALYAPRFQANPGLLDDFQKLMFATAVTLDYYREQAGISDDEAISLTLSTAARAVAELQVDLTGLEEIIAAGLRLRVAVIPRDPVGPIQ